MFAERKKWIVVPVFDTYTILLFIYPTSSYNGGWSIFGWKASNAPRESRAVMFGAQRSITRTHKLKISIHLSQEEFF